MKLEYSYSRGDSMAQFPDKDLQNVIRQELQAAKQSREQGNEGKARVCARRAAGWAAESIYDGEQHLPESNAYRFLIWFREQDDLPAELRKAADRLTTRVREDFSLPFDQDPIEDAELIVEWILAHGGLS
jgi:hypothetical protein